MSERRLRVSQSILVVFFAILWVPSAWAYRAGRVSLDGAELKQSPDPGSRTLQRVRRGTPFSAADTPRNGYYYVRVPTGLGWLPEHSLWFSPAGSGAAARARNYRHQSSGPVGPHLTLQILAGMDFNSPADLDAIYGSNSLGGAIHYAGELDWQFARRWELALRVAEITTGVTGTDKTTGNTYQVSLTGMPIYGGINFDLVRNSDVSLLLGLYAGYGSANLTSTATNLSAPNTTILTASAMAILPALEFRWHLSRAFGLSANAGYDLFKTPQVSPSTTGAGSQIFVGPAALDFSGPEVEVGIAFSFL